MIALLAACFDSEDDDLEIIDKSQPVSVLNTNPRRTVGEAGDSAHPTPIDQAAVVYSAMHGDRSQDSLVFVDHPARAWQDFWVNGNREPIPTRTNRGVGVSWYDACSKGGFCGARDFAFTELACSDFVSDLPSSPACSEKAAGVVTRSFFSWDRGACSKRVDASATLQQLVDQASAKLAGGVGSGKPLFSSAQAEALAEAQSAIWVGERQDPQGGLALRLKLETHVTGLVHLDWLLQPVPFVSEAHADVTGGFRWVVKDGVLGVEPLRTRVTHSSNRNAVDTAIVPHVHVWDAPIDGNLVRALTDDVPRAVTAAAYEEQLLEIKELLTDHLTICEQPSDCTSGPAKLYTNSIIGFAKSADLLSDDEATTLTELFRDENQWVCTVREQNRATTTPGTATPKTCNLLMRAKRVNAYPNGVELVFREGGERPMTREFALEMGSRYAVAHRPPGASKGMCDPPAHRAKLSMDFVTKVSHATYR